MGKIMRFNEFNLNENVSSKTFTLNFQDDYFDAKSGSYINIEKINKKYGDKFISEMEKLGYKVMKDYVVDKTRYVDFDKEIYNNSNTTELFDKISKERDSEIKNNK